MLKQYLKIKSEHKDCILFFRLGDFYEMFFEDAKEAAQILDLVLTSRGANKSEKIPMCGIPYHASESYIARLIKAGRKVAICEQVEDPALAKGLVKRKVTRIITSGTFIDENSNSPRYILSLSPNKKNCGLAFTDTSSGTIFTNQYPQIDKIVEIISKLPAYECIFPDTEKEKIDEIFSHPLLRMKKTYLTPCPSWMFNIDIAGKSIQDHFKTYNLRGFGIDNLSYAQKSSGALLAYLKEMNKQPLKHIDQISVYAGSDYVYISPSAVYGLELNQLNEIIDFTLTAMGKRKLSYWIYHPLIDISEIKKRQQAVHLLKENGKIQTALSRLLKNIPDVEKSLSRISCGYTRPRDFLSLRNALTRLPEIQQAIQPIAYKNSLFSLIDVPDIRTLLEKAINPNIPLSNPEGKVIQKAYSKELDEIRNIQQTGREWLKKLQSEEIKRTGINSLKIGFNKVFGYYIEITKANLKSAPSDYIRKQTLVNAERFITPALKEFEEKMLSASEKVLEIERKLLDEIQSKILSRSTSLHAFSSGIAVLDSIYSLSILANSPGYVMPEINDSDIINIKNGRHPVVEKTIPGQFIPNDTVSDCKDNNLLIITGPNMAGKSTYIRQTAILVILAQTGSFIPAESAEIGIADKVFTRIGAHDEISKGQSTFMVEMTETAEILNNLSEKSLIILDEIGRGTSTFDGLSLAWATAEYLQKNKARTLFATHFHELTALAEEYSGVKNYNIAVREWNDEIVFLHKIVKGGTDDSYGIYVAKLAGIPKEVLIRAKKILTQLELYGGIKEKIRNLPEKNKQLSLFSKTAGAEIEEIKKELKSLDINSLTPLEALNKIYRWKGLIKD